MDTGFLSTTSSVGPSTPLSQKTIQNLSDRLYEKRKQGALEIEEHIRQLNPDKDSDQINTIINYLISNFIHSSNSNARKGGLIGLAGVAIATSQSPVYFEVVFPPVIGSFADPDPKVRYYACEALYNISKIARERILTHFNEVFDGICRLVADPDPNVKNGSQLLDRLVGDIMSESQGFEIESFIPLLKERIVVSNPFVRQFILGWLRVLHSVPDIDLLEFLPEFLDGILAMLSDENVQRDAKNLLGEFLEEIKASRNVDFGSLIKILIPYCTISDETTQHTALVWVKDFISIGKEQILPFCAPLLSGILPCISHNVQELKDQAVKANNSLLQLINETNHEFSIGAILNTVSLQFLNSYVPTRLAALYWVMVLHTKFAEKLNPYLAELFPALLKTLSDPSDAVVRQDLEVMAMISQNEVYFDKLMTSLINLFSSDPPLLESRGSLIIRQLSIHVNPENIFRALAQILESCSDLEFASTMVQNLNIILLTSSECFELRNSLKTLSEAKSIDLFTTLYKSWCHNPAATFSFCLLAQQYKHASDLLLKFAEMDITVSFLVEIDKLVQLLESPIFISLRLQLLEPKRYPYLFKCLYGLLMLLPQSSAFETLRARLNSVSTLGVLQLMPQTDEEDPDLKQITFEELLQHFEAVQKKHSEYRRKVRRENELRLKQG